MPKVATEEVPATPKSEGSRDMLKWVLWLAALVIVLAVLWTVWGSDMGSKASVGKGYQAVFLNNGQVYFGKMADTGRWTKLTDIYYLQVTQQLQPADNGSKSTSSSASSNTTDPSAQPNIQLVKLGSELHGPEDQMFIEKDKILFWENMKDDSKVVQAIQKYKEGQK